MSKWKDWKKEGLVMGEAVDRLMIERNRALDLLEELRPAYYPGGRLAQGMDDLLDECREKKPLRCGHCNRTINYPVPVGHGVGWCMQCAQEAAEKPPTYTSEPTVREKVNAYLKSKDITNADKELIDILANEMDNQRTRNAKTCVMLRDQQIAINELKEKLDGRL